MRYLYFLLMAFSSICLHPVYGEENERYMMYSLQGNQFDDNCELEGDDDNEGWGRIIAGGAYGKYIGLDHGYLEFGFIGATPLSAQGQLFGDARAFYISNNHWSESLGLGYRYSCDNVRGCDYEVLGLNAYYDGLQKKIAACACGNPEEDGESRHRQRNFNRLGLGVEYLSTCVDIRVNGYIPVGKTSYKGKRRHFTFPGDIHGSCRSTVFLPWGADGEIGSNYRFCEEYMNAYLGVGGYYYKHQNDKGFTGIQARFELSWMEYLSLQLLYSYDHEFSSKYQGKILLSIPLSTLCNFFCASGNDGCYEFDPLHQLVKRNYVPFLDESCCWNWNWP